MKNTQHTNDNSAIQFLGIDTATSAETTETISRRRSPGLWIGAAGLVIGFGISQLSTASSGALLEPTVAPSAIAEPAVAEHEFASDESAWSGSASSDQQELNRAEALGDLGPDPDFTSHDVAEARRMHTLSEVFGADNTDCGVDEAEANDAVPE